MSCPSYVELVDRHLPLDRPLATIRSVATAGGVANSTVHKWIANGEVEGVQLSARGWRVTTPSARAKLGIKD